MHFAAKLAAVAALAVASAFAPTATAVAAPPRAEERTSLLAVADAADAAWDAGDAIGIADVYTNDATFVLGTGREVTGREAIRQWFREYFAGRPAGRRLVTHVDRISMLQPGIALLDGRVRVEERREDGTWVVVREYANYCVAVRDADRWRLHEVRAIPAVTDARFASR